MGREGGAGPWASPPWACPGQWWALAAGGGSGAGRLRAQSPPWLKMHKISAKTAELKDPELGCSNDTPKL